MTPLSWAAWNGYEATVKLLLEKGADMESKDLVMAGRRYCWPRGTGMRRL